MRDAVTVSIVKTLSEWGVAGDNLRQAYLLLEQSTMEQLEGAWICHLERRDVVNEEVVQIGLERLGLTIDKATGHARVDRTEGESDEDYQARAARLVAKSDEALGVEIAIEGRRHFQYDSRRHFRYALVSDQAELARLMALEGGDVRVHHLRRHVESVLEAARAMGFSEETINNGN